MPKRPLDSRIIVVRRPPVSTSNHDAATEDRKRETKTNIRTRALMSGGSEGPKIPREGTGEERARERMEKYKEERRRQLAAYRLKQKSSSDDSHSSEDPVPSYMRYAKSGRKTSPSPQRTPQTMSASPPREVRSNRAARLRAAKNTEMSKSDYIQRSSSDQSTLKINTGPDHNQNHTTALTSPAFSSDSTASLESSNGNGKKKDKDKSAKRKSNLNRSIHEESAEDGGGRRRRPMEDTPLCGSISDYSADTASSFREMSRPTSNGTKRFDSSCESRNSTLDYVNSRKTSVKQTSIRNAKPVANVSQMSSESSSPREPERTPPDLRSGLRKTTDSIPSFLRKNQKKSEEGAEWLHHLKTRRETQRVDSSSSSDSDDVCDSGTGEGLAVAVAPTLQHNPQADEPLLNMCERILEVSKNLSNAHRERKVSSVCAPKLKHDVDGEIISILKRPSLDGSSSTVLAEQPQGILKKKSIDELEPQGILRKKEDPDPARRTSILRKSSREENSKTVFREGQVTFSTDGRLRRKSFGDDGRFPSSERLNLKSSSESSPSTERDERRKSAGDETKIRFPERSILKSREVSTERCHSPEPKGIMKKHSFSLDPVELKPILKKRCSSEELEVAEPKSILKKKHSTDEDSDDKPAPILKLRARSSEELSDPPLPILKMRPDEDDDVSSSDPRPILKSKKSLDESEDRPKSILKRKSLEEAEAPKLEATEARRSIIKPKGKSNEVDTANSYSEVNSLEEILSTSNPSKTEERSFDDMFTPGSDAQEKPAESSSIAAIVRRSSSDAASKAKLIDKMDGELLSILRSRKSDDDTESEKGIEEKPEKLQEAEAATTQVSVMDRIKRLQSMAEEQNSSRMLPSNSENRFTSKGTSSLERSNSSRTNTISGTVKPNRRNNERYKTQPVTSGEKLSAEKMPMDSRESLVKKYFQEDSIKEALQPQPLTSRHSGKQVTEATNLAVKAPVAAVESIKPCTVIHAQEEHEEAAPASTEESSEFGTRLNVRDKAKMFSEKQQKLILPRTTSAVRRPINRLRQLRSQTQPVTPDEVHQAVRINAEKACTPDNDEHEDDLTRLSLMQRLKIFSPQQTNEDEQPKKREPPRRRRVTRKSSPARFQTQPVTTQEIQGALPSPLAASLAAPPEDLEKLGSMSIQAARRSMYEYGQEGIKNSRPVIQTRERTPPDGAPSSHKGILKYEGKTDGQSERRSILKEADNPPLEQLKSILKNDDERAGQHRSSTSGTSFEEKLRRASTDDVKQGSRHDSSSSSEDLFVPPDKNLALALASISEQAREENSGAFQPSPKQSQGKKKRTENLRRQEEQRKLFEKPPIMPGQKTIICTEKCEKSLQSILQDDDMKLNGIQESKTTVTTECLSGGNLKDRVAMLSHHGETAWKDRLPKLKNEDPEVEVKSTSHSKSKRRTRDERPSSLKDRINLLEVAQEGWKNRVGDKDAKHFTVEGKLERLGKNVLTPTTPQSTEKCCPKLVKFRSKTGPDPLPLDALESTPKVRASTSASRMSLQLPLLSKSDVKVEIPQADNESFSSFFQSLKMDSKIEGSDMFDGDLDEIFETSSHDMLATKRSVKVTRRNVGSRNPLKALAARTDIQQEYTQVFTGFAQKEVKRMNIEKVSANASLAMEALAGLASKEDFKAVSLRKKEDSPEENIKLIQIKGRRHTQTRLVEPVAASINSGDTYILVTPTEVFTFIGEFSNVIEKSRAADLANIIVTKRELSCSAKGVSNIDEEKRTSGSHVSRFWKALNAPENRSATSPGSPEEDELYEQSVMNTNLVWEVVGDELIPLEECWGTTPKYNILQEDKVIVFDYGAEMFVWHGKKSTLEARKTGKKLAQELWEHGYDYSECGFNPLNGAPHRQPSPYPLKDSKRPAWAMLFLRENQYMENILFREKFLDWPDMTRVIRVRDSKEKELVNVDGCLELQPCDAEEMIEAEEPEPDLLLEGANLSRGEKYYDEKERRMFEITSISVCMWYIQEFESLQLEPDSMGQLHQGDAYVFRWKYHIKQKGRTLGGKESKHTQTGRERCAYFFWQGRDSTVSEKGTSALMTVELDRELGPQVRVAQGTESPAFLNLFGGNLIIYSGKRGEEVDRGDWRLFACRGSRPNEGFLVEVPVRNKSLRSRGCFLLVSLANNAIIVWHGAKSSRHSRKVAVHCAEQVKERHPLEMEFQSSDPIEITEEKEGEETAIFRKVLGKVVVESNSSSVGPYRMWEFISWTGDFQAIPILCSYRDKEFPVQLPFYQPDLYNANQQPALFLLDCGKDLWIWQGWWPEGDEDNNNMATGSGRLRWTQQRRAAISTAFDYAKRKYPKSTPDVWLVWAGLEPDSFKEYFLEWEDHEDVASLNEGKGHAVEGAKVNATIVFEELSKSHFTLEELLSRPLPEGVHPLKLEQYLTDEDFQTVMEMSREEFYKQQSWKQTNMKQAVGLF